LIRSAVYRISFVHITDTLNAEDGERLPLVHKPPSRSLRQSCFAWRAFMDQRPLLLSALQASLGLLFFAHIALSLLLCVSAVLDVPFKAWRVTRSVAFLPVFALCIEIATLCIALLVIIYSDFSKRRVRGVTVWQREAVGRILRNLVVSILLGISVWQLYTRLILKRGDIELKGGLLSALGGTVCLCVVATVKLTLVRTKEGIYWLGLALAALVFQGLLVCKVDYGAIFSWSSVVFPLYTVPLLGLLHCLASLSSFFSSADKDQRYLHLLPVLLRLLAALLSAVAIFHVQQALDRVLPTLSATLYLLLLALPVGIAALCIPVGSSLLDIVWGHVEMDFLHSKSPAGLARSRSM